MSSGICWNNVDRIYEKIDINIKALSIAGCKDVINEVDIVLLSPQVRFQVSRVNALVDGRVLVKAIDVILYGMMNGQVFI